MLWLNYAIQRMIGETQTLGKDIAYIRRMRREQRTNSKGNRETPEQTRVSSESDVEGLSEQVDNNR